LYPSPRGTFTRAVASYSVLTSERTIAGRDVYGMVGQAGLIEARQGGKSFAQMYGALALRSFGTELDATGNTALGKGSRGYIPLYLNIEAHDIALAPEKPLNWTLVLTARPPNPEKAR